MNDYSYITVEQRKRTREIDDALSLGRWGRAHALVAEQRSADDALLAWLKARLPATLAAPDVRERLRVALACHEASTITLDLAQQAMLTAMRTQATEAQALAEAMLSAEQAGE